tara:strand:+ start:1111 stop:1533 length:423 start_codon:yes stop_codon:yes gene_type:complete
MNGICIECNEPVDEVVECSECGCFCPNCYEKQANQWYHAPLEESEHHCRDLCPKCSRLKVSEVIAEVDLTDIDPRELYRTKPSEILRFIEQVGVRCTFCEGSDFSNPIATPFDSLRGVTTVYLDCACGECLVTTIEGDVK